MRRLVTIGTLLALALSGLRADDKPGRAEQLKAIRADLAKADAEFRKAIKDGTIKPDTDGEYPGWAESHKRLVKPTRAVIDADPADALGLEALLFALAELKATDADLFALVLKHHAASDTLGALVWQPSTPVEFVREVAAKSPHVLLRLRSQFYLAEREYEAGRPSEALKLLEHLERDPALRAIPVSENRQLPSLVTSLQFEIRNLSVGQVAPQATGDDLDGKPLKLTDSRGKITLLVFWAAGCRPCMAMVPHEVELVERYAGRPFAIVGVNSDVLAGGNFIMHGPDGKPIASTARLKVLVQTSKITWRSFRHGQWGAGEESGIGYRWNVQSWPTVYLLDEAGVIRGKWKGTPPTKVLDAAVEKLVRAAEAK